MSRSLTDRGAATRGTCAATRPYAPAVQAGVVHRTKREIALDRTIVAAIVLGLFAFYVSIQAGVLVSRDAKTMASVGRNLWQHASLHRYLPGHRKLWSPYGIGVSLMTVPLWAVQLRLAPHGQGWVSSGNTVITTVTGGFLYRCGVEVGWRRTVAVLTVLVFGLLTMAPMYSTEMFSEPGVTLGIVVTLLGLLLWSRRSRHGPWLVGAGLSVAVLFRTDSFADGGPAVPGAGAPVRPATRAARHCAPLAGPGRRAAARRLGLDARLQPDPLPEGLRHLLRQGQLHEPVARRRLPPGPEPR